MAEFTPVERQFLESIPDSRLHTSLAAIRQAVEDIWATDAPRIIQDYTDHGIGHSERLASLAAQLLEANDGQHLSEQEMYLLLAGIYLHDIGMQCDVVLFPVIKGKAEMLGAHFDVEFNAQTTSGYNIDEQKAIRKNHQYLTTAWIDYAYRTGETALGQAAKTIREDLVADLMDVCKHHAKIPITDCPFNSEFDPTQRKQLVASLLRFVDELDMDGHRVSIATVRNFRLGPRNAVYWWLHSRTKVIFSARNVILLKIRLSPEDAKHYGPSIHTAFITKFQAKNRPILSVLRRNSIPVAISMDSGIVEDSYANPLPPEIVQALQAMQEKQDPPSKVADEELARTPASQRGDTSSHFDAIRTKLLDFELNGITKEQKVAMSRELDRCMKNDAIAGRNATLGMQIQEMQKRLNTLAPKGSFEYDFSNLNEWKLLSGRGFEFKDHSLKLVDHDHLRNVLLNDRFSEFVNGEIECEVYLEEGALFNVMLRGDISNDFYMARLDTRPIYRDCFLIRPAGKGWKECNAINTLKHHSPHKQWLKMRVVADENRLSLYRDNMLVDEINDAKVISGTIGLFAEVSNVYVRKVRVLPEPT